MDCNDITILCKVIDNYGDIGFVYRLARALSELDARRRLRLVVSDLAAFKCLAPHLDAMAAVQQYRCDGGACKRTAADGEPAVSSSAACGGSAGDVTDMEHATATDGDSGDTGGRSGTDVAHGETSAGARNGNTGGDSACDMEHATATGIGDDGESSAHWLIYDWNAASVCARAFRDEPPTVILECFQCGRPDWLEALLFADDDDGAALCGTNGRVVPIANAAHLVRIFNIDYLTAERYADDFHCLKSGTRSLYVKKVNFMPGFTAKTGGLVLDRAFLCSLATRTLPSQVEALVAFAFSADDNAFAEKNTPPTAMDNASEETNTGEIQFRIGAAQRGCGCTIRDESAQQCVLRSAAFCDAAPQTVSGSASEELERKPRHFRAGMALRGGGRMVCDEVRLSVLRRAASCDVASQTASSSASGVAGSEGSPFRTGAAPRGGGHMVDGAGMQVWTSRDAAPFPAATAPTAGVRRFLVPVFSYGRDYAAVVAALARLQTKRRVVDAAFSVCALVAAGKGRESFLHAWEHAGKPFAAADLPFLPQEDWDRVLCAADFSFVRGEDSLSRACLAGAPFVWHAYPQEDDYQLVKVRALLARVQPYLPQALVAPLERVWLSYNTANALDGEALFTLLAQHEALAAAFRAFSHTLITNGNLAEHLLGYLAAL